jgi:DNA polymerase-3 subunit beta
MVVEFLSGEWKKDIKALASVATANKTNLAWKMLHFNCETQMVTASNDSIVIMSKLPFSTTSKESFLIEGDKIASVVSTQPDNAKVKLEISNDSVLFKTGSSRFKLGTLPVKEYARSDKPTKMSQYFLNSDTFKKALASTAPFASDQSDVRIMLRGVNFDSDGESISMTSSNGHYLSHVEFKDAEIKLHEGNIGTKAIFPLEFVKQAQRLTAESSKLMLYVGEEKVCISSPTQMIWSKVIDAKYVDTKALLQIGKEEGFTPDVGAWRSAMVRIKPLSNMKLRNPVEISSDKGLMKLTVNNEIGESEEVVDAVQLDLANSILLNMNYLDEVLRIHDDVKVIIPEEEAKTVHFVEKSANFSSHQMISVLRS